MDQIEAPTGRSLSPRLSRRLFAALGGLGALVSVGQPVAAQSPRPRGAAPADMVHGTDFGLQPGAPQDQTATLQAAIDAAAQRRLPLFVAAGTYKIERIALRSHSHLRGVAGSTVLAAGPRGLTIVGQDIAGVQVEDVVLDGEHRNPFAGSRALLQFERVRDLLLRRTHVRRSGTNGVSLTTVGGVVEQVHIEACSSAALWSTDGLGIIVSQCLISDCADNGLLIWRSAPGADGTMVRDNRIARIGNASGGSGQFGNGINIYRAHGVSVHGNHISDCSYSAIRGNAASTLQVIGNTALRSGEVAIYAEFGFEGAVIANNIVDDAGSGIAVTNFNEGGRLAVVQGNIVRNLKRREFEAVDKRGEGISVEADTMVSGNVIEDAPTAGIQIGWGRYMRNVVAASNIVRRAKIGIAVTGDAGAGQCLIAQNLISHATDGAVRAMDHGHAVNGDLTLSGSVAPRHITMIGNAVN